MVGKFYEDFSVGDTQEFGNYTVEKEEIIAYGKKYDPQPFHTNEDAAEESAFGGLIASGLLTAGIGQRMLVENFIHGSRARGSLGIDNLRWRHPVRPGDTLSMKTEIVEKEIWNDDYGIVSVSIEIRNQEGEIAASLIGLIRYERREERE
ncbi:MaoC family dehydratase [Natrialba asiatica]|uniref:MaoC domain-containing protein dehydratase n=1 Tax=Natrialba asiatica (strain ATCC 700177 / DSM 12278 / JCM 9576 / FERM P-10747 / NBRC 102637 / 172P1) TaxID=29540 RepID=M0B580_NATA1|nr:MaoC family dehydratase [Natrialba asiatica]ELZ06046.1 MaoC domain-containing protein dehydratase [Natrialba asiatica DSM 12278]